LCYIYTSVLEILSPQTKVTRNTGRESEKRGGKHEKKDKERTKEHDFKMKHKTTHLITYNGTTNQKYKCLRVTQIR
jgi:hypothetical protein